MMEIMRTDRLLLRLFSGNDVDAFYHLCNDPEVMQFIGDGSVPTKKAVRQSIKRWCLRYEESGFTLMALVLQDTNELIGFCGLITQEIRGVKKVELGYRLGKAYWGCGYATEAAQAVKTYAKDKLGLEEVISLIQPGNRASLNVSKKIGMCLLEKRTFGGQAVEIHHVVLAQ